MTVCLLAVVLWLVVSQLIAWMIAGPNAKRDDEMVELWRAVFLAPPLIALAILNKLEKWIKKCCGIS